MSFYAWPYPPPPSDPIMSFGVQGDRFTINGKIQNLRGFTDFASLNTFIRQGGAPSPLAVQMQKLHHDFVCLATPVMSPRVLLMKNAGSLFDLDPRTVPSYFNVLDGWAAAQQKQNLAPLCVLLADCAANGMNLDYQRGFVRDAVAVLRKYPFPLELVNEYDNGPQQVDPMAFDHPFGVIISRGSPAEGGPIPWEAWDFITTRYRRDAKWLQTIGDSGFSYRNGQQDGPSAGNRITIPLFDSEPRGAGETEQGGKRYTSTADAYLLGLDSAAWNHAFIFHSDAGLTSTEMGPVEMNCAITAFRGVMAVPEVP